MITASGMSQAQKKGTFTDPRDGQVYKTITIVDDLKGTSVTWMSQNLNYQVNGARPYFDDEASRKDLGLLYTFEQAKQACPTGWHIPSKAEFESLLKKYTIESLKSIDGWSNNSGGTNSSGFNAYPAGYYCGFGGLLGYDYLGSIVKYWTTTYKYDDIYKETAPSYLYIPATGDTGFDSGGNYSVSLRCLKNN